MPDKSIEEIIREDGRYPLKAVQFVRRGLNYTVDKYKSVAEDMGSYGDMVDSGSYMQRHITGQQLCMGLRELAIETWGPMAKSVLKKWNITKTRDFGEIVFMLVNSGHLQKTQEDCIEDFDDVYDFDEAFDIL